MVLRGVGSVYLVDEVVPVDLGWIIGVGGVLGFELLWEFGVE
ncbi:MAG: hypothetical protein ACKVIY_10895 [Acidimicrobiales bacterium]